MTMDSMSAHLEKGFVEQSKSRFAPVSTSTLELVAPRELEPVDNVIALESSSHEPLVEDPVPSLPCKSQLVDLVLASK